MIYSCKNTTDKIAKRAAYMATTIGNLSLDECNFMVLMGNQTIEELRANLVEQCVGKFWTHHIPTDNMLVVVFEEVRDALLFDFTYN
jgi:hypothetical protein